MFGNNNNKLQQSGKRYGYNIDGQGRYVENLEHIRGNAATGEQLHSARVFRTEKPMTFQEMKVHWDEMNREAKEWLDKNPGQSANFLISRDGSGNEIIKVVPAKDLIFSGSHLVAIYDEKTGKQIVGKENIIKEVQRRRMERDQWIREGKMENTFDEVHHTDDGWTSEVKFTAYPDQLHPNEVKSETERLIRLATEKRQRQLENSGSQEFSEETPNLVDVSSKKSKIEENESASLMEITDEKMKKASEGELRNILNRIISELGRRDAERQNSSDYAVSTEQLKNQANKLESVLNNFLTSPNNSPKPINSILPAVGIISVASLLIGSLVFWKKSKNNK